MAGDGAGVGAVGRQPAWMAGKAGRMRRGRRGAASASAGPGPDAAATILPLELGLDPLDPSASQALVAGLGDGGAGGGVDAAAVAVDAAAMAWGTAVSGGAGGFGDLVVDARVFGSEAMRVLGAAILDQHSIWWAVASPLFALSVAPYLLFLRNIWAAPTARLTLVHVRAQLEQLQDTFMS